MPWKITKSIYAPLSEDAEHTLNISGKAPLASQPRRPDTKEEYSLNDNGMHFAKISALYTFGVFVVCVPILGRVVKAASPVSLVVG